MLSTADILFQFLQSIDKEVQRVKCNLVLFSLSPGKVRHVLIYTELSQNQVNMSECKCKRLEGKIAIVVAATHGIGFAIAKRLAQEGASVMICSRREENVKEAVQKLIDKGLNVTGVVCHVANPDDRKNMLKETVRKFGGLDILICVAGVNPIPGTLILDCSEEAWDKMFNVNVKGPFFLIKESLPLLKKSKAASIVVISTIAAYTNNLGVYGTSKISLQAMCKGIANHHSKDGIRINCIAPGLLRTRFSRVLYSNKEEEEKLLQIIPMKRMGTPDEVAGVTAFLVSEDASFITGETIIVAGGQNSSRL